MKKSRPTQHGGQHRGSTQVAAVLTDDEALHLVLPQHVDAQRLAELVVEHVRAAARGHDAQLARLRAVELQLLVAEALHELDAVVDAVRLEALEVEAAAGLRRVRLAGEVDELDERAANLRGHCQPGGQSACGSGRRSGRRRAYVDGDVAHHGRVVRQPDIARLVVRGTAPAVALGGPRGGPRRRRGRGRVRVHDKGALDVDADAAGPRYRVVNLLGRRGHGHGPRPRRRLLGGGGRAVVPDGGSHADAQSVRHALRRRIEPAGRLCLSTASLRAEGAGDDDGRDGLAGWLRGARGGRCATAYR